MSLRNRVRWSVASLAATGALALAASPASAAAFQFDTDGVNLGSLPALGSPAGFAGEMRWSQEVGGSTIHARLVGNEWHNGGVAGCVRIRVEYRNSAGTVIGTDQSDEQCTPNGIPTAWRGVSESFSSSALRSARVRLQVRQFGQTSFSNVQSVVVQAGGA